MRGWKVEKRGWSGVRRRERERWGLEQRGGEVRNGRGDRCGRIDWRGGFFEGWRDRLDEEVMVEKEA